MVVRLGHPVFRLVMGVLVRLFLNVVLELLGFELTAARDAQLSGLARQTLLAASACDTMYMSRLSVWMTGGLVASLRMLVGSHATFKIPQRRAGREEFNLAQVG